MNNQKTLTGVGNRIKEARCAKGISQKTLGLYCGLKGQSTIANYECGFRTPSLLIASKLALILDVSPSWLCFGRGEK